MSITTRLTLLERKATDHTTVRLIIPYIWRLTDDEDWQGIPTDAECDQLADALATAGVQPTSLQWQGSVAATLETNRLRLTPDQTRARTTLRVVPSPPPYKAYGGFDPNWV